VGGLVVYGQLLVAVRGLGSRLIITLAKGTGTGPLGFLLYSNSGVVRQPRIAAQYLRRWRSTHWVFGCLGRAQDGKSPLWLAMTEAISGACWGLKD
jgi:hypothetical protein